MKQQTADCLTIMKESLERAGSSMANVLKVQVSLVDPVNNWAPMTEVYNTFFPDPRPARNYFGATGFRRPGQHLVAQPDASAQSHFAQLLLAESNASESVLLKSLADAETAERHRRTPAAADRGIRVDRL